jgi:hypothetical protein
VYSEEHDHVTKLIIWGGRHVRGVEVSIASSDLEEPPLNTWLSNVARAPDWILDLAPRPTSLDDDTEYEKGLCVAITAHNALLQIVQMQEHAPQGTTSRSIVQFFSHPSQNLDNRCPRAHFEFSVDLVFGARVL